MDMDGWDDDQDVRTYDCAVAVLSTHKRGLTIIILVGAIEVEVTQRRDE